MTRARHWIVLLGIWLLGTVAASCVPAAGVANGLAPDPFLGAWRACGGVDGAGEWLAGPFWFEGNLVGIATNMVFVWQADAPQSGARPLSIYPLSGSSATPRAGAVYVNGHNVPPSIVSWIRSHGGWRCAGAPVAEPVDIGHLICQTFTHLVICYDPKSHQVAPRAVGAQFLQAKARLLSLDLPTTMQPAAGWDTQVNVSLRQGNHWMVINSRTVGPAGKQCASIALQVNDLHASRVSRITYKIAPCGAQKQGIWQTTVALPGLLPGKHIIIVKLCAVSQHGWLACDEDSVTLTLPQPGR